MMQLSIGLAGDTWRTDIDARGVSLTDGLRQEYSDLFATCVVRPECLADASRLVTLVERQQPRYEVEAQRADVPWHVISILNGMECNFGFARHLANGDPLTGRTVHVPIGRPPEGAPPFSWEESATDALAFSGLGAWHDWSLSGTLYQLERYNGFGYRMHHPEVLSPYLWAFSNHYTAGKYTADGKWSAKAVSRQCGAAVLLRKMVDQGIVPRSAFATPMLAPASTTRSPSNGPL